MIQRIDGWAKVPQPWRMDRGKRPLTVTDVALGFGLVGLLTVPFWILSAASGAQLMPGLPVAAFSVVCPGTAALVVTLRRQGWTGVRALLRRLGDAPQVRPRIWWLAALGISPLVAILCFTAQRLAGAPVPAPQFTPLAVVSLSAIFLVAGACEDLGWTGAFLAPLQSRWGTLPASLVLGLVWAVWHYPALLQAHRSWDWIAWWTLGTLSMRVIYIQVSTAAGRTLTPAIVMHAVSNLCWQLYPLQGSWFDPRLHGLFMAAAAVALSLTPNAPQRR